MSDEHGQIGETPITDGLVWIYKKFPQPCPRRQAEIQGLLRAGGIGGKKLIRDLCKIINELELPKQCPWEVIPIGFAQLLANLGARYVARYRSEQLGLYWAGESDHNLHERMLEEFAWVGNRIQVWLTKACKEIQQCIGEWQVVVERAFMAFALTNTDANHALPFFNRLKELPMPAPAT